MSSCQVALVVSTLASIPCWEFGRAMINTNSLLDNYLWAYYVYLCLLLFAYLVFHRVNYQNTRDTNLGSSSQGKTSPSWRGKLVKNFSYGSSIDKYHYQDSDPWPMNASKTLSLLLCWPPTLILLFCTNLHYPTPTLESSVSRSIFLGYSTTSFPHTYFYVVAKVTRDPFWSEQSSFSS